ncbi:transcription factor Opi1-domain-containing protein [Mycena rebaudengoi]|nr:transcription factor Opi1-domain-containing protein [Mycena rebaudengoi]
MNLELEDEDVRIAVRALGDMRSGAQQKPEGNSNNNSGFAFPTATPTPNSHSRNSPRSSTSHTPALSLSLASTHPSESPPRTPPPDGEEQSDRDRDATQQPYSSLARMSSLPLVSGALRVYEAGKANSRVVQYTSTLVSTSLRHASSRLPAGSGERMDEFAGGVLDRLDKYRGSPAPAPAPPVRRGKTLDGSPAPSFDAPPSGSGSASTSSSTSTPAYRGAERDDDNAYMNSRDGDGYINNADGDERSTSTSISGAPSKGKRKRGADKGAVPGWLEATSPFVAAPPPPPPFEASGSGSGHFDSSGAGAHLHHRILPPLQLEHHHPDDQHHHANNNHHQQQHNNNNSQQHQVAQRSRWHAMLLEAGGLSAALSDESMRRLRYVLGWLQYATQHIDAQILILRDFIASLGDPSSGDAQYPPDHPDYQPQHITPDHLRTLAHLRSDIVHTIRQVVGVISKYAGGALPEPARGRVRGFILELPRRFGEGGAAAGAAGGGAAAGGGSAGASGSSATGTGTAVRREMRRERGTGVSSPGSPVGSRPGSPQALRNRHGGGAGHSRHGSASGEVEASKAVAAARRVLTLATESLDMMRGVTAVVGDSLDRADAWVDRLRTVGIQRGMDGLALPEGGMPMSPQTWGGEESGARSAGSLGGTSGMGTPGSMGLRVGSSSMPPTPGGDAPSPGFGLGGMSLESGPGSPAPLEEEERREQQQHREQREWERERAQMESRPRPESRMDVDG